MCVCSRQNVSLSVENKAILCCPPLTCSAFKKGISVPLRKAVHPNNGLISYSQFDEAVRLAINCDIPFDNKIQHVVTLLQSHTSACVDTKKENKRLVFISETAVETFITETVFYERLLFCSKCSYDEQLKDFLVLPSKRNLQYCIC